MVTVQILVPKSYNSFVCEQMFVRSIATNDLLDGLVSRGSLSRHSLSQLNIELSNNRMIIEDIMTGNQILTCIW